MNLAKALQVAEIVTISKGAETRSALGRKNHHKRRYAKLERERKMCRDGDGESEVVDEYRFNGGGQGSGRGSSLECGGGGLEDEGVLEHDKGGVLQHDGGGIECGEGGKLEDGGGGQEEDGDGEDVGSMSSNDGSDFETDQNNTEDAGEDSGREDATREFKVNVVNKDKSDNDGTHFEESIEASDSCKESETVNCEQTGGTRQRGEEVRTEDKESVSDDNIQQDKDLLQGGNKRDDMTVKQTGVCAQDENEGNHLRDRRCDSRQAGMSVRDSETESDITRNIEKGGVAKIEGGTDDQETGADPISDNIRTDPDSENGQVVTNSLQVQQRGVVNQVMDISRLSADSVVVLDESNKVDSALFKALKGMGAQLSGNESEASKCERLSEPSQTLAKVSSGSFTDPQLKPDPVLLVNTPAMIKYRKHKTEEYLKRLRKLHDKSASECIICEYCGAVLNSKNLANHIAAFHTVDTRERRYQCEVCGNLYLRHENLQRHLSTHSGAKVCCGHCGKSFQHEYSLKAHKKTHWEIPPSLPVRKPKYRTLDPKTRRPRDKRQSETNQQEVDPIVRRSKQVSCQMCGKTVSCKSLCRHLRTVHKVINEASRSHSKKSSEETCITCGKTVSRRYLKRHLHIHSETGPRQENRLVACEICGKVLRKASMRNHLGTHNPKMSKCEICGKVIRNGSKYSHAKLHTDKREHACSYCDFRFHFRSSLVTHLRRHTKERPIPCRYCEQTFSRYETRNIHERLHTGERPYKCEVCHKAWRDRATYSHHMQKYHPKSPMQRKLWPPPAPTPIQSDVQQVIKCNPGVIKAEVSV